MFSISGTSHNLGVTGSEERSVLLAGCGTDGIVVPWDGAWQDDMGASQYGAESTIWDMLQVEIDTDHFLDKYVYCATGGTGLLLRYDIDPATGEGAFTEAAATEAATDVYCIAAYDDGGGHKHIYGGTDGARLLIWDGTMGNAWTEVCAQANGDQDEIWDLVVHNGFLYGCTGPDGYLVRYDVGAGHWDVMTAALGDDIFSLLVFKGRLYGAGLDGHLYRWNDADAWESICAEFVGGNTPTEEQVLSMINFNGRLMGGTTEGAYLLEWLRTQKYNQPQCIVLRRLLSAGQKRDLCVFIAEGPKFDADEGGWNEHAFTEMLRFVAYDPTMYDPAMVTEDFGALGTGSISASEDIAYSGTWETHPKLILTGPLNYPAIVHEGLDEVIALNFEIPAGSVVTIDLHMGTVTDATGLNLLGMLTPDSSLGTWRLVPEPELTGGVNTIRLTAGGATVGSEFHIEYFTRYVGI
jgi:hypothetical protein